MTFDTNFILYGENLNLAFFMSYAGVCLKALNMLEQNLGSQLGSLVVSGLCLVNVPRELRFFPVCTDSDSFRC